MLHSFSLKIKIRRFKKFANYFLHFNFIFSGASKRLEYSFYCLLYSLWPVNDKLFFVARHCQRPKKARKPEGMVSMPVSKKYPCNLIDAQACFPELKLRGFPAINKYSLLSIADEKCRMISFLCRNHAPCSQKDNFYFFCHVILSLFNQENPIN